MNTLPIIQIISPRVPGARFLFASRPSVMGEMPGIATHLIRKAGLTRKTDRAGADTLIQ